MSGLKTSITKRPKILVVDDNPANLLVVRKLLSKLDIELVEASSGNDALKATLDNEFALILLDVYMPDMSGFEVADFLLQEEHTRQTPVIFVTATYADDLHRLKGYGFGAVDYMAKPLDGTILLSKVHVFLELYRSKVALRDALAELSARNRQLEAEIVERKRIEAEVRHLAAHDGLTGLPNRMLFMQRLQEAIARSQEKAGRLALIYLDIDAFKEINDAHGHSAGDAVLCTLARRLLDHLGPDDTAARLGGDEFAVIVAEVADVDAAMRRAGELHRQLHEPLLHRQGSSELALPLHSSIGLAVFPDHGDSADAIIFAADQAMYTAKRAGGVRPVSAGAAS